MAKLNTVKWLDSLWAQAVAAALLLGDPPPAGLDPARYAPDRF